MIVDLNQYNLNLLIWDTIGWSCWAAALGLSVVFTSWVWRQYKQQNADVKRTTYELSHPADMTEEQVLEAVDGLLRELPSFGFLKPAYPAFFEKYGSHTEKKYYLSLPDHLDEKARLLLEASIVGIYLDEVKPENDLVARTAWEDGVELGMAGLHHPLDIPNAKSVALRLDANFNGLSDNEALVMQVGIVPDRPRTPTKETKDKIDGRMAHAIMRIAGTGEHTRRNLANLKATLRGVGSENSQLTQRMVAGPVMRLRRRAGRPHPLYLNQREFAALMGWQLDGSGSQRARRLEAHRFIPRDEGILLASSNHTRTRGQMLRIPVSMLPQHQWVIGPTGSGKSALLHCQAEQFARMGLGFALIDPKGDLARDVLYSIPESRINDVIFFDPADEGFPIGLNILAGDNPHRTTSNIVAMFKKKFKDSWGPQLEMNMRTAVYTACESGLSIFEVIELLRNPDFRRPYVRKLKDETAKRDWRDIDARGESYLYSTINKIVTLTANPLMQNIVAQTSGLNMRDVILGKKILLISLTDDIGETNAEVMGEILIDQLWRAAKSIPAAQKSTFPFIVDEFQRFVETNDNIADMLALARSYGIAFIGAHQFSGQLDKANKHIRPAMENNTGTKITFREERDAENMADFFHPLKPIDIHSLGLHEVAMSVMTEQGKAPTVTGLTYPPPHPSGFGPAAREASRKNYGRPRAQVVAEIAARYKGLDEEREQTQVGRLPR